MPPPALASLAKKAGKTLKDAERYYADAKKQVKPDSDDDYRLVMGIVKKRLGLKTKPLAASAESFIDSVLYGEKGFSLIEMVSGGDTQVKTFFDSGMLCFATPDDVMIESNVDDRISAMMSIVNEEDWPNGHPIYDLFENYEGSLDYLFDSFTRLVKLERIDLD